MTTTAKRKGARRVRPEKAAQLAEIRDRVATGAFLFLADYTGLNSGRTSDLRGRLRKIGARMQVVPNRLFRESVKATGPDLQAFLKGSTAMIVGTGEVTECAKLLVQFHKEFKMPVLKAGAFEGRALSAADVQTLAALPSKQVLRAMAVGTIAAPMGGLVGVLQQKLASVVYVLKAAQEKKGQSAAA
ncbi:MAG: 50S ribosomal protein L10 [Lentisphaerae bacterium]|nr:50S ribosomal protein L10 [Lentisphaerota bacterium]